MSEETKKAGETAEQKTEQTADAAKESEATKAAEANDKAEGRDKGDKKKVKKLESRITELEKKLADSEASVKEQEGKYMMLYAEYDNFRRRTQKEKDGIWTDAYSDAINKLLPVLDNLYRALDSKDASGLSAGLEMTVKSYEDALSKMGVEEIKAMGETFDPSLHAAVFHVDDDKYGEGEIIEVLAKGYIRDGKVIRYSVVKVAN